MIRHGEIDLFGITAWEYAKVLDFVDPNSLLVEDYLWRTAWSMSCWCTMPVHSRNSATFTAGHLTTHIHRDMNLVPAWIGNLLSNDNLPRMDVFFADQVARDSITQVVLPVFFRRMDAACLARRYFETAVELNPQLGKDLRALAISPKVVPIALCFQKNCSVASQQVFKDAIARSSALPAGQQIAALYQSRTFISRPPSVMNVTPGDVARIRTRARSHAAAREGTSLSGPALERRVQSVLCRVSSAENVECRTYAGMIYAGMASENRPGRRNVHGVQANAVRCAERV